MIVRAARPKRPSPTPAMSVASPIMYAQRASVMYANPRNAAASTRIIQE